VPPDFLRAGEDAAVLREAFRLPTIDNVEAERGRGASRFLPVALVNQPSPRA
jgi:hypothetical protein